MIPVGGKSDAFEFVDPEKYDENNADPYTVVTTPSGTVGDKSIAKLKIRVKDATSQTNTNKAKLRIVVKTANDEQTIVVENLCSGHDYNEYTLVQNII